MHDIIFSKFSFCGVVILSRFIPKFPSGYVEVTVKGNISVEISRISFLSVYKGLVAKHTVHSGAYNNLNIY